jgi:hypothetical protein
VNADIIGASEKRGREQMRVEYEPPRKKKKKKNEEEEEEE